MDTNTGRMTIQWSSGLNVIAGLWVIFSPFILGFSSHTSSMWNCIVVGILVVLFAGARVLGAYRESWLSWANVILGAWLFASPWIYGNSNNSTILWEDIVLGVVVAVLALISALANPVTDRDRLMTR